MPVYVYKCDNCKETFEINHGMFFEQDGCTLCHTQGYLSKVLDSSSIRIKKIQSCGKIVEKFISDSRKELENQKDEAKGAEKK